MDYRVGLSEAARDDLGMVVRFLAAQSPEAAVRIGDEILDAALALSVLPHRGAPVRRRTGLRKLSHRHWLIFYQVNEPERWVEIIRIWDGRQHPATLNLSSRIVV
jgi:plasmid stabilization system protein ParE